MLTDQGALLILGAYFNKTNPVIPDLTLKLFVNNIVPTDATITADLVEAVGGGYVAKTLTAGLWTPYIDLGISQVSYETQNFAFTGPLTTNTTIYGYYIVDADGVLLVAEVAAAPFAPVVVGDSVGITPVHKLSKGTPA